MSANEPAQAFLGEEFLTWLWFRRDTEGGEFQLGERTVEIALDDFLAFAPGESDETEQTLRKGLPTRTAEARAALRSGRRVRSAKLLVADGNQHWSLVLDGPTLQMSSVRMGEEDSDDTTPRDRSVARAAGFVDVFDVVAGVYELFLRDRLRQDYLATSGESQAQWMAG